VASSAGAVDARGRRLRAALAAVLVRDNTPELQLIHEWLDTRSGLGLNFDGMTHHHAQVDHGPVAAASAVRVNSLRFHTIPRVHVRRSRRRGGSRSCSSAGA
jgi:hypothetical protein